MERLIIRQNKMFSIDRTKLNRKANKEDVCQALYAAIYSEFFGAIDKTEYKDLTPIQKLEKVNEFAWEWLKQRGLQ